MGLGFGDDSKAAAMWRERQREPDDPTFWAELQKQQEGPQDPSTEVLRRLDRIEGQLARLLDKSGD